MDQEERGGEIFSDFGSSNRDDGSPGTEFRVAPSKSLWHVTKLPCVGLGIFHLTLLSSFAILLLFSLQYPTYGDGKSLHKPAADVQLILDGPTDCT